MQEAVAILRRGELVAFPTETVYGLGADAESPAALARLYAVKGRPETHPVIVHLAEVGQMSAWAREIPTAAQLLAEAFWPGPLTLILPRQLRVPDAVTGGQDTVGLRVPSHPMALALLKAFGGGIAAPSANRFGRLSPTSAAHVRQDLGDDVPCVLDGGDCPVGVESTIVAFREGVPVILRPGMITEAQIAAVLAGTGPHPAWHASSLSSETPQNAPSLGIRAPGTLSQHYAPRTRLRLLQSEDLGAEIARYLAAAHGVGVVSTLSMPDGWPDSMTWRQLPDDPAAYARLLYATLRSLDAMALSEILVAAVPASDAWAAVADRLRRAAAGHAPNDTVAG